MLITCFKSHEPVPCFVLFRQIEHSCHLIIFQMSVSVSAMIHQQTKNWIQTVTLLKQKPTIHLESNLGLETRMDSRAVNREQAQQQGELLSEHLPGPPPAYFLAAGDGRTLPLVGAHAIHTRSELKRLSWLGRDSGSFHTGGSAWGSASPLWVCWGTSAQSSVPSRTYYSSPNENILLQEYNIIPNTYFFRKN